MAYYFHTKKRTIPLPIALVLIMLLAVFLSIFYRRLEQGPKKTPTISLLEIGSITASTAKVYWRTDTPSKSYLLLGSSERSVREKIYDGRDKSNLPKSRYNHIVSIVDLKPNTNYFFKLVDEGSKQQAGDKSFTFKTTAKHTQISDRPPVYGKVVNEQGQGENDAVVMFELENSMPLLTTTKSDGSFTFSLCCLFEKGIVRPLGENVRDDDLSTITIFPEISDKSSSTRKLAQASPFSEPLVLGYKELPQGDALGTSTQTLERSPSKAVYDTIDIIYPLPEARIAGTRPLFKGLALAGNSVIGKILPEDREFNVTAGQDKLWYYTPDIGLDFGNHTITITSKNSSGQTIAKSSQFFILESGSSVLAESTRSATLSPTIALPTVASTSPTIEPTTISVSPTISLTPRAGPPVSGSSILPSVAISSALILVGLGVLFLF